MTITTQGSWQKIGGVLLLLVSLLWAQGSDKSTLFSFLNTTFDARSLGRGTIASVSKRGEYVRSNPALASEVSIANVALGFQPYGFDTYNGFISGVVLTPHHVAIAPSLHYITYGGVDIYDSLGGSLGDALYPFSLAVATAVSYKWSDIFSVGGAITVAYEKLTPHIDEIIDETYGIATLLDIGMLYKIKQLRLASGVRNLGFWWGYESDVKDQWHLPTTLYASLLWSIPSKVPVGLYFEMEKQLYQALLFKGAFELSFKRDAFAIRIGSTISTDELQELFTQGTKEVYSYSKSDWHIFSTGFTFRVPIQSRTLFFDAGVGFRSDGLDPQFAFSGGMDF